jgi:hypothetical protein
MVTRHALQVSRSGQGYIDLHKSLEWTRKRGTNFEDGPEKVVRFKKKIMK